MLALGAKIPEFQTITSSGLTVSNESLLGKWTALYFYPKDDTPGCTAQACSLRDSYANLSALGVTVYGISADSPKKHNSFIEKYDLPFELLLDTDHVIAELFETWVEKSLYGKKYLGIERSTYIIDPMGKIVGAYQKVTPKGHGEFLLGEIKQLQKG